MENIRQIERAVRLALGAALILAALLLSLAAGAIVGGIAAAIVGLYAIATGMTRY